MSKYGDYRVIITNEDEGGLWENGKSAKRKGSDEYEHINFIDLDGSNHEGLFVLQFLQLHIRLLWNLIGMMMLVSLFEYNCNKALITCWQRALWMHHMERCLPSANVLCCIPGLHFLCCFLTLMFSSVCLIVINFIFRTGPAGKKNQMGTSRRQRFCRCIKTPQAIWSPT